jgi:type II restriction/modification system DNA methylase subunit YeeA
MNKTALKNFATSARRELLKKVEAKALKIGITADKITKADIESSDAIFIDGRQLSKEEKIQRDKLIARIKQKGFIQVMEEVAYTWFNRFTALRYMEVNNYLPTKVRVLSSGNAESVEPDMIKEALSLDLDLDKELVYELKVNNKTEELFKYLIIKHCNDLNRFMPFMFETIDDYSEILFPHGLLAKDSFIDQMTNLAIISEEDWEQVEIIGWLYQYYNTEMNELVYDGSMSKNKIPKELLPAATQLFTPDWAVKYMVENSLGRLWSERTINSNYNPKDKWEYYLDNEKTSNTKDTEAPFEQLSPEDIKLIDPCMGSGHILVYAFDVLMQIYESCGYTQREATKLILQKNLYGLEIEGRAYQLACFALMMKARKYNRRILNEQIELNLCSIEESNEILNFEEIDLKLDDNNFRTLNYLISIYYNAKEYGSILDIEDKDFDHLQKAILELTNNEIYDLFQSDFLNKLNEILPRLIKQAKIMSQNYDVVITNPPYLGNARMSPLLSEYVKEYYPNTKSDLSMVMYQKSIESYSKPKGFISFITTTSWMFLTSFEKFREQLLSSTQFTSIVDFGTELFDGKVGHNPIVSWVIRNSSPTENMVAIRLVDFCYSKRDQKKSEYFNLRNRYFPNQKDFHKIPGSPIAYWVNESFAESFAQKKVADYYEVKSGIMTGNDPIHLKFWYEVEYQKINSFCQDSKDMADYTWFPINKGGEYRHYFGNNNYVINLKNNGENIKSKSKNYRLRDKKYYFKKGITWSRVSSSDIAFRENDLGTLFGDAGPIIFVDDDNERLYLLGLLISKITNEILKFINPTLNYQIRDIESLPLLFGHKSEIIEKVKENLLISKMDWDFNETSRDFIKHPIISSKNDNNLIKASFLNWELFNEKQYNQLKENQQEINRIFIEVYGLQNELTSDVTDKEITLRRPNLQIEIKSLISYAVGCLFGRYSLDKDGLIYAGGEFDHNKYQTFPADKDNILPILPGAYFEDDIVSRFIEFVRVTFGEGTLAENLDFIADTLGKKKGETAKETIGRFFLNDFFKNHVQTFKKRPIYWLFTSGKQNAFNCLIYMHRFDKTTLSRIRTDYLHEYQIRLDAEKKDLLNIIEGDSSAKEISNAKRELKVLDKKIEELKEYDELLHHMADMQIEMDLDDGVAVNYEKLKGLVAKI